VVVLKFDMHCHTKEGSIDGKVPVARYAELLKDEGFDGMLVTDHDSYKGYQWSADNREQMPADFMVLMGVEYDTKDSGHFLVIMPDGIKLKALQIRGMSIELLIQLVHHFGGILGPAHPFGMRSSSAMLFSKLAKDPHLIREFDFIEGFNTCETIQANQLAQKLADKYNKQCFGGTDAHKEEYIGMGFTDFDRDITCNNDLIACVKDGGVAAFGGTERKLLLRHMKRYSLTATYGFRGYNRLLGLVFTPYRRSKVRNAFEHKL